MIMLNREIIFKLNDTQKIVITPEESLNDIHCCSRALITFNNGNEILKLEDDTLSHNLHILISLLTDAINNRLPLHNSLKKKIGYLAAQYSFYAYDADKLKKLGLILDKNNVWIGKNYQLWGWDFAGWIYNDKDGNIILELTPRYKKGWFDPDDTNKTKEYTEFLKNYKSYFTTIIPREVARQWLNQATIILEQINENVERDMREIEAAKEYDA